CCSALPAVPPSAHSQRASGRDVEALSWIRPTSASWSKTSQSSLGCGLSGHVRQSVKTILHVSPVPVVLQRTKKCVEIRNGPGSGRIIAYQPMHVACGNELVPVGCADVIETIDPSLLVGAAELVTRYVVEHSLDKI